MQKVIVVSNNRDFNEPIFEEVEYDGTTKRIALILNIDERYKNKDTELMIMEDFTFISGTHVNMKKECSFFLGDLMFNTKVAVIGLKNIVFNEPLLTLKEVKKLYSVEPAV